MLLTLAGEEKIPLPMIKPIINDNPFKVVRLLFLSRLCCPLPSKFGVLGVPKAVYPGPDDDRGNRALLKSKALDTEYERRAWPFVRAGVASFSKDSLRELGTPDIEES